MKQDIKARMNPKLEGYFRNAAQWREEFEKLRTIILGCPELTEDMKWGQACYALDKRNVVLIHGFKEYCAVLFFKGALLKDARGVLARPGEHTQAGRQMRFTSVRDIVKMKAVLKDYIQEAIEVEKAGLKVTLKKTTEFTIPDEFQKRLDSTPTLKAAFEALTPGRQRAYILHFSSAKQSKTRESRVEKCVPQILAGEGLND
jgi:uncharacterized protein YdeI (YjbR/CyaY-like superfamily)